jgi:hypothetical protein
LLDFRSWLKRVHYVNGSVIFAAPSVMYHRLSELIVILWAMQFVNWMWRNEARRPLSYRAANENDTDCTSIFMNV